MDSLGSKLRSGIAGSHGSSISSFLRTLHNDFHRGCTHMHSHRKGMVFSLSTNPCIHPPRHPYTHAPTHVSTHPRIRTPMHPRQHLCHLFSDWGKMKPPNSFNLHFFPIVNDADHFKNYHLAICNHPFEVLLLHVLAHSFKWSLDFLMFHFIQWSFYSAVRKMESNEWSRK